jgi:hypothetical protein
MIILDDGFTFSQSCLQDFMDCPRRFDYKYIQKLRCPALQSEPYLEMEKRTEMGVAFHKMVYLSQMGFPYQIMQNQMGSQLEEWMTRYSNSTLIGSLPSKKYMEFSLQIPLNGYRVLAKYDLIAVKPGTQMIIVDWKTNPRRPKPSALKNRAQSRLYRFIAVAAGESINDQLPVLPGHVKMVYWFTNFPDDPEVIPYNDHEWEIDHNWIGNMIDDIAHRSSGDFEMTADENRCLFCSYRSICNRGVKAGGEMDGYLEFEGSETDDFSLDIHQVDEVEF